MNETVPVSLTEAEISRILTVIMNADGNAEDMRNDIQILAKLSQAQEQFPHDRT